MGAIAPVTAFKAASHTVPGRNEGVSWGREQRLAAANEVNQQINRVQSFFADLGVKDSEGNGQIKSIGFQPGYPNAHYQPVKDEVVIGTNPISGKSFAAGDGDVVAHELTHRVIDRITKLSLRGPDVAIHEHVADVFAAAFDSDDWTIGEDAGSIIRDMKNPERLGHPSHYRDVQSAMDAGRGAAMLDWHAVAGVPNKAAVKIGDTLGRKAMAELYLDALRNGIKSGIGLTGMADVVVGSAQRKFGADTPQYNTVVDAFKGVGLLEEPAN